MGKKIKAYSKAERKSLSDAVEEPQPVQASLRAEALEFVPGSAVAAAVAAEATAAKMTDYSWPCHGLNPFMQFPYGWPGSSPMAGRLPSTAPSGARAAGRHVGTIKSYNATKGFGFVECPEVFARYKRDVFIHKDQIGDTKVGDNVIFTVETNKQGMPQAKEVTTITGVPVAPEGAPVGGKGKKGGKDNGKGTGKGKGLKGEGKSKGAGKAKPGEQVKDEAESRPKAEETGDSKAEEPEGS
jgi:cold shock CspA family protein